MGIIAGVAEYIYIFFFLAFSLRSLGEANPGKNQGVIFLPREVAILLIQECAEFRNVDVDQLHILSNTKSESRKFKPVLEMNYKFKN